MQTPLSQYHPDAPPVAAGDAADLWRLCRCLLHGEPARYGGDWQDLLDRADTEGLLQWLAWNALSKDRLAVPDPAALERLKTCYRAAVGAKLLVEAELGRLFGAARALGIPVLVIKGEALARSLYPEPACRPTADFDLLVEPASVPAMHALVEDLGYEAWLGYFGEHILAGQFLLRRDASSSRVYQLDLHWDVTNRRFLRRRLPLSALFADARPIPLPGGEISAPSHAHALLIACVHLAAAPLSDHLQLKWLLDIRLLLDSLSDAEMGGLLEQARGWKLADVLGLYCAMADTVLGPCRHRERIAEMEAGVSGPRRRIYQWTCDRRWFDLAEYGLRLKGVAERRAFLKQVIAYRKTKRDL